MHGGVAVAAECRRSCQAPQWEQKSPFRPRSLWGAAAFLSNYKCFTLRSVNIDISSDLKMKLQLLCCQALKVLNEPEVSPQKILL